MLIANEKARRYSALSVELSDLHSELVGISNALPPVSPTEPEIRMTTLPIQIPCFNLPSARSNSSEWIAVAEYRANEYAVASVSEKWSAARERLANDVEADVSNLLENAA